MAKKSDKSSSPTPTNKTSKSGGQLKFINNSIIFFSIILIVIILFTIKLIPNSLNLLSSTSPISEINDLTTTTTRVLESTNSVDIEPDTQTSYTYENHPLFAPPTPHFNTGFVKERSSAVKPLESMYRASGAMPAKFRSLYHRPIYLWYVSGDEKVYQGTLKPGQETTINSYITHNFIATTTDSKGEETILSDFIMDPDDHIYLIPADPNHPSPYEKQTQAELDFVKSYLEKNNYPWKHYYGPNGPRKPPVHFMWPAERIGDVHTVQSLQGYWNCTGDVSSCFILKPKTLNLQVISQRPRAFVIKNFLTESECDHIINRIKMDKNFKTSRVGDAEAGAFESSTRTSKNGWLSSDTDDILSTISHRAADLLQISSYKFFKSSLPLVNKFNKLKSLYHNLKENIKNSRNLKSLLENYHPLETGEAPNFPQNIRFHPLNEDLQVVHYDIGQKYDSHHDWGVSGYPESRYITLLFYLSDQVDPEAGGETSFPLGVIPENRYKKIEKQINENGEEVEVEVEVVEKELKGFKVHPGKGSAVLFYNLLPDGNGDVESLHAALPVRRGEKWLANFWVWDPKRKD